MKLQVLSIDGGATGRELELPAEIFDIEPNEHAVYLAVKQYNAHQRQGTHKAKERNEVKGSTRKIKRQKGTGTARAGDIKNPLFRGGGRIFGPRPRTYTQRLNKKVKALARKSVLSAKAQNNEIVIVEDFSFDAPKTKQYLAVLNNLKVNDEALSAKKTLLMTDGKEDNVYRSLRNLPKAEMVNAVEFNVYQALNADYLIISESAVERLKANFESKPKAELLND